MKNLFSKTLLCGVLASSFLLINCQKAPNRAVKAQVTPTAKPSVKTGDCDANIATNFDLLKKSNQKIQDKLKSITGDVGASDIEELNGLVKELNALAKKVMGDIGTLKLDSCKIHDGNDVKKPVTDTADISIIRQVRSKAGADVKAKTKVDNEITLEDKTAGTDSLAVGQELKVTADLAAILSDSKNSDGAAVISGGKIEKNADAAKALLDNKAVTACALKVTSSDVINADQSIKVIAPLDAAKLDDASKRNVLKVFVAAVVAAEVETSPAAIQLICNIAEGKEKDAAKEVRTALGSLVSNVIKTGSEVQTPPADDQAAPPADQAPAPAPAANSAKKALAAEGLSILDQAAARK